MTRYRLTEKEDNPYNSDVESWTGSDLDQYSTNVPCVADLYGFDADEGLGDNIMIPIKKNRSTRADNDQQQTENDSRAEQTFLSQAFGKSTKSNSGNEYHILYLDNFHIYKTGQKKRPAPLHVVTSKNHTPVTPYCFSGTLCHRDGRYISIEALKIVGVQIDNFETFRDPDDESPNTSSCRDAIWIQTKQSRILNCFYRLRTPSQTYSDVFRSFEWLATFAKHVNDYVAWSSKNNNEVRLCDFKEKFHAKLCEWHGKDPLFLEWLEESGNTSDFQRHIASARNADFIYEQIYSVSQDDGVALLNQPLWNEVAPQNLRDTFNYKELLKCATYVTPLVKQCFGATFPKWKVRKSGQELLTIASMAPSVLRERNKHCESIGLTSKYEYDQTDHFEEHDGRKISIAALLLERAAFDGTKFIPETMPDDIVGKAVIIRTDTEYRYAYVRDSSADMRWLSVTWLVLPNRTVCEGSTAGRVRNMSPTFYPIGNELLFSDECICIDVRVSKLVAVYGISILQDHAEPGDHLFVQKRYIHKERAICCVSKETIGLCCQHESDHPQANADKASASSVGLLNIPKDRKFGQILSLFSGFGLFDRGFETGAKDLFQTTLAVDCDNAA